MKNNAEFKFDPSDDFATPVVLRARQEFFLRSHLQFCQTHSPFYQQRFRGLDFSNFSLDQFSELPLTEKRDISENPEAFLASPMSDVEDIVFSSGTTGEPCRIAYTRSDMQRLAYNEQRCFHAAGMTPDDQVLLTCTLDRCFVAGMAYYLGVRAIGATAIRNGLNTVESHLTVIKTTKPTIIIGVPSFLRGLGKACRANGVDITSVRTLICIGEPIRNPALQLSGLGEQLANLWNANIHSTYASSEIVTSFCDCPAGCGGHLIPELAYAEILDEQGNVLPDGEVGELTVTPFRVTGMPLVRYRTGDMTFMTHEPCVCGRFSPRIGPILGRKAQMLKCRGTTLYPQALYNVLDTAPEVAEYYLQISGEQLSDQIEVFVAFKESGAELQKLAERLYAQCRLHIPITEITLAAARQQVFATSRKPVRFVDLRGK